MAMKESKKDNNPLPLEVKSKDDSWEATLADDLENENRAKDSPINDDQNGILLNLCPNTPASDSLRTDTNPFTDKNVLECELPELVVCYKEIDYNAVKDICVDEGLPVKDNIVIGHYEDDVVRKNDDDEKLLAHEKTKSPPDGSLDKDEGSLVDEKLPIQEFGTRSFLRSFMGSLDDDENNPNQIPSDKEDSNGPDSQPESLLHNGKVENGSIISNLNGPENAKEHPVDSGNVHEQPLIIEDGKSDESSADSQVQSGNSKNKNEELVHEQQSVSSFTNNDEQAFEGESSFAVGRVSYSGPIAFSGSISHRSEGSAASGRSFAFPVLQNEWNSSPVRMRKAERRLKHKGWIFCCRF